MSLVENIRIVIIFLYITRNHFLCVSDLFVLFLFVLLTNQ